MNKRVFFQSVVIALILLFNFSSCNKDEVNEMSQDVSQHIVSVDYIDKTETAIENVLSSYDGSSVDNFVSQIKELENIKNVEVRNELVYITTTTDWLVSVDLYGKTSKTPITAEDKVDTCGTYIQSVIDALEKETADSTTVGVEIDPIPSDSIPSDSIVVGDEPIDTRALYLGSRKILTKKRMAVWSPWDEFQNYDEKNFESAVINSNLECRKIRNYGPSSFASFGQYDLVFVSCHGADDGAICIPQIYWDLYVEQYSTTKKDGKKYVDSKAAREAGIRTHFEKDGEKILKAVALERVFFEKHLSNLSNTIIWTSACHMGKTNSAFMLGALTKGCKEFYGADNICNGVGPMSAFKQFLPLFANGASTKVAFDRVDYSFRFYNNNDISYEFVRHGNSNITYVNPFVTGIRQSNIRTAIVGVKFHFSLDIAGSTKTETPNHFGLQLVNVKTNLAQHIPLSSSNILNATTRVLYNSIQVYFANIKLTGLMPNTDYLYRTYIMVEGKRHYSIQYQRFNTGGLTGTWKIHIEATPDGSIEDSYYTSYMHFTEDNFDENNPGGYRNYSTKVLGNTITFESWTPPYRGTCGADLCASYVGTINDEWTYIKCATWGWRSYGEPQTYCVGKHHHNMDHQYKYEFWRLPDTYQ